VLIITLMAEITFVFNKKLGLLANALTNYNVDVALMKLTSLFHRHGGLVRLGLLIRRFVMKN